MCGSLLKKKLSIHILIPRKYTEKNSYIGERDRKTQLLHEKESTAFFLPELPGICSSRVVI